MSRLTNRSEKQNGGKDFHANCRLSFSLQLQYRYALMRENVMESASLHRGRAADRDNMVRVVLTIVVMEERA